MFVLLRSLNQVFYDFIRIHYVGWSDTLPVGSCGPQLTLIHASADFGLHLDMIDAWLVSRVKVGQFFGKPLALLRGE